MAKATPRTFTSSPATRRKVPLIMSIVSPSGAGKTKSSLRLATGMARIDGKPIACIDTEADRALFYAPKEGEVARPPETFDFRHVPFSAPFDPLAYLAAIEHCVREGAGTIIVDSGSHMHEGPGGTLEAHAVETTRLAALWRTSEDKAQMSAWQKPKSELRSFLNTLLQLKVNVIFCIRAKEKVKIITGKPPVSLGYMPVSGDELIFEMALNVLLLPGADGVPTWHPEELGEKAIVKLPRQFRPLFEQFKGQPLSEEIGEALARWAAGGDAVVAGAASSGGGAAPAASKPAAKPVAPVDKGAPASEENQLAWVGFWSKRGVTVERVLARFDRPGVGQLTIGDLETMAGMERDLKAKRATLDGLFPVPGAEYLGDAPPIDDTEAGSGG